MNRQFIEQEKRYKMLMRETVPRIYAAFALALHREYGFGFSRILRVLADTQEYWNEAANGDMDIVKVCEEETGINVVSTTTAKANNLEGERI